MFFSKNLANFVNMKTSIDFLPKRKQRDLHELVKLIREEVKDAMMIILYGSYATNTYVERDVRRNYGGGKIEYKSDYDILVVTKRRLGEREGTVESRVRDRFAIGKRDDEITKVQLVSESITKLNDALSMGRYFYVDAISEGIMLFNTGESELATPRDLNYSEIKGMALEYYEDQLHDVKRHYQHFELDLSHPDYQYCAFDLHQVTEHLIKAIPLSFILYGHKEHDLNYLLEKTRQHTLELTTVFPRDTEEEKRLFNLLRRAYLEARYNRKNFIVTKEDIDALVPKIELLRDIVEKVCKERFDYYDQQIKKCQ